jgi:hypothetical protein
MGGSLSFLSLRTFCRLGFSYHFSVVLSLPVNPCGRLRLLEDQASSLLMRLLFDGHGGAAYDLSSAQCFE